MRRLATGSLAALAMALVVIGCASTPGGGGDTSQVGTLRVGLTDAASDFESLVVTIAQVRVVPAGSENLGDEQVPHIVTFDPPRQYDIMGLRFRQELLGEAEVPAGAYSQVRLILAGDTDSAPANYYTLKSDPGTIYPLKTPSGQQSGLKVNGSFTVLPDVINAIVLDFDPDRAVVLAGNSGQALLKPTGVRIVEVGDIWEYFGAISGRVIPTGELGDVLPRVSAYPAGEATPISSMQTFTDDVTGDLWFRLFLPEGEYSLTIEHPAHMTFDSAALDPAVLYSVAVGAETDAGDIKLLPRPGLAVSVRPEGAWGSAAVDVLRWDGAEWQLVAEDAGVWQDDGLFAMPLAPGTYALYITADGFDDLDTRVLPEGAGLYEVLPDVTTILEPIELAAAAP